MTSTRRVLSFLFVLGFAVVFPVGAQNKRNKAEKQMTGVVASVEQAGGMFTLRLDNGDMFSAPADRVRVRDMRVANSLKTAPETTGSGKPRRRAARISAAASESVPVGSRVVVRRKLDQNGELKRVVVRILAN